MHAHRPEPRVRAEPVHRSTIFALVAVALLMLSLDGTIVATALHTMQDGLHTSTAWIGWTITAYSLGLVLMLPVAGKLSEVYGRRTVFIASITVFTLASLCCGLATDIYMLVVLRFLQAIGGAGFTPAATGIIVENFGNSRDKAVGLFGSIFPIGTMVGPMLGGLFVSYASWRWIFFVNVPIGLALIPLCLRFIPSDKTVDPVRPRVDLAGVALLGVTLGAFMTGMSGLATATGGRRLFSLGLLALAAVALVAFLAHIRRAPDAIIEPRLIWGRGFAAVNGVNVLCGGAVAGLVALLPFYATTRYGIGALGAGTLLVAQSVAVIVLSLAASALIRRTGYRWPLYVGTLVMAGGVAVLSLSPVAVGPHMWLAVAAAFVGAGMGWLGPASRNAGLQLAPERSASIAAMRSLGRQIGMISSVSVTTAIVAAAADPAAAQALVYAAFPVVLLAALLVIHRVPEHRGAW